MLGCSMIACMLSANYRYDCVRTTLRCKDGTVVQWMGTFASQEDIGFEPLFVEFAGSTRVHVGLLRNMKVRQIGESKFPVGATVSMMIGV